MFSRDIIFLHGFMGESQDWETVAALLESRFHCHCLNMPPQNILSSIVEIADALKLEKCVIAGYSMGGRLAMMLKNQYPDRFETAIIISAHLGLKKKTERTARWQKDLKWAEMLETRPFEEFLEAWYAQSYFTTLRARPEIFDPMMERRRRQNPKELAEVMRTYSLAKQPCLYAPDSLYLCGGRDLTYVKLYHTLPPSCKVRVIPECSHNLVLENPAACAAEIEHFLEETYAKR